MSHSDSETTDSVQLTCSTVYVWFVGTVRRFMEKYGEDIEAVVFVATGVDEVSE